MMTLKKRRIILVLCVLAFLIVVPIILLYSNGFRLDAGFHLVKTGGLYVSSPVSGSEIFINNDLKKTTNILQSGLFLQNLKPGKYPVLVAKEGYWPWAKELEIKEQSVAEARALMLPENPEGKILKSKEILPADIQKTNEIIAEIQQIKNLSATTTPIEKYTGNKKQKLWWNPQENKVWVDWMGDENSLPYFFSEKSVLVLNSLFSVRNADFMPGRRDIIVVAVQNGVFAIEIDGRGGRMLQPIYKGKSPVFIFDKKNDSVVYVLDEDALLEIKLE